MTTHLRFRTRSASRAIALAAPLLVVLAAAGPAAANPPEGWSDPDPVSVLAALAVFLLAPLAVIAVTVGLTLMPRWAAAAKAAPTFSAVEPNAGLDELLTADPPAELESAEEA